MARMDREVVNKSCTNGLVVDYYEGSELKTFRNAMKKGRLKAALNCGGRIGFTEPRTGVPKCDNFKRKNSASGEQRFDRDLAGG